MCSILISGFRWGKIKLQEAFSQSAVEVNVGRGRERKSEKDVFNESGLSANGAGESGCQKPGVSAVRTDIGGWET